MLARRHFLVNIRNRRTVAASSNVTRCLWRLPRTLAGSHSVPEFPEFRRAGRLRTSLPHEDGRLPCFRSGYRREAVSLM
jgi:hypothetical protein